MEKRLAHRYPIIIRLLIKLGSPSGLKPEERHRRIPALFILIAGILTMVIFTPYHLYSGHYHIAVADVVALAFFIISLFYLSRMQRGLPVYWMISLVFLVICSITVVLGREEISFFLWALVPPSIIFSVLGKKGGITTSLLFLVVTLLLMTAPERIMHSRPYSAYVIGRYTAIYMILTFILYYYESSQQLLFGYIQREKEKFEHASKRDPLTGLSNRREMMEKIREEQQRQLRLKNPFTLIVGDIDDFKKLNDTYGHDAGDYVLNSVAQLLKDQVRGVDCPSRWGGEEFLILLIETDIEGAQAVAERIRNRLEKAVFTFEGKPLSVTMTFGLSEYQGANDTIDGCIQRADKALYAGKHQGKNRAVVS